MDLIYLIGEPGVGKSTAVELLLSGRRRIQHATPLAHDMVPDLNMAVLGKRQAPFGGTDTLPMNVARTAEAWISSRPARTVLGEGDRLAYRGWFEAARAAGYNLRLLLLDAPPGTAELRRGIRAAEHGLKMQNPTWVAGRGTKARRLAGELNAAVVDASQGPAAVAAEILRLVPGLFG